MAANLPTDCRQVPKQRLQPCFPLGMTRHRDPDWPHNAFVGQQPVPQGEPCMSCHSAPWSTLLCTCWRRLRALRGDETRACRARWSRLMIAILNPAGAIADTNTPVERIRRCWGEWFSDFLWRCDIKSKACVWDFSPHIKSSYTTPHYDPKYLFFCSISPFDQGSQRAAIRSLPGGKISYFAIFFLPVRRLYGGGQWMLVRPHPLEARLMHGGRGEGGGEEYRTDNLLIPLICPLSYGRWWGRLCM